MTRSRIAFIAIILISVFALVWITTPTVKAAVPLWIIVDALVAQIIVIAASAKT